MPLDALNRIIQVSVGPSTNVPSNTVICFNKEDDFGDVDEVRIEFLKSYILMRFYRPL